MDLPRTAAAAGRYLWLPSAGSTNTALVERARADPAAWPDGAVLATDVQTAGRGRLGRAWTAPPHTSLAVSVLLRPRLRAEAWGWLPLVAGAAMAGAITRAGIVARVKWPNDVLIGGRKVCGVLSEALPDGAGVVIGAGLNHAVPADALPVPTATSLLAEGARGTDVDVDGLLTEYLTELRAEVSALAAADGDATAAGVLPLVSAACETLGRPVRALLPDGSVLTGVATELADDGRLVIRGPDGRPEPIAAGDVEHLRYE